MSLMVSSCAGRKALQNHPGPTINVLSWNVNYGGIGQHNAAAFLAESKADIICLQETTTSWERALRDLKKVYPYHVFHHSPGAGGQAIFSKYPMTRKHFHQTEAGWFPYFSGIVKTPLGKLQLVSVHLRPPVSDSGSWVSGYFSTGNIRESELKEIVKNLKKDNPVLIVGDFNERSGDGHSFLKKAGMTNLLDNFDRGSTWRWQVGYLTVRNRLDHAYGRDLLALEGRVIKYGLSDHYPITVTVGRKE